MFLQAKTAHFVRKLVGDFPQTPTIMARPKKELKALKAIRVNVRMTVDEYLILTHNAKTLGITIPEYIRKKVTGKVLPKTKITPHNRELFVQLSRIGNNINQLAKNSNIGIKNPIYLNEQLLELKNTLNTVKSNIVNNDS